MQVRFTTSIATPRGAFLQGQVIDVATLSGTVLRWLRQGLVVAVSPVPEVAIAPLGPETPTLPRPRRRYRRRRVPLTPEGV